MSALIWRAMEPAHDRLPPLPDQDGAFLADARRTPLGREAAGQPVEHFADLVDVAQDVGAQRRDTTPRLGASATKPRSRSSISACCTGWRETS